jgi:hypothetical protein
MKKQRESTLVLALFVSFVFSMAVILPGTTMAGPPAFVPKTGQTVSYAEGDDGDLQAGVDLPSPRFTDNNDGTVTDNLTKLIWLKNANCFGAKDWDEALSVANELADGSCDLSDGSVPGDWRLPTVKELLSLMHYDYFDPALSNAEGTGQWSDGDPFTDVPLSMGKWVFFYWTSTTRQDLTNDAWCVTSYNGFGWVNMKTSDYHPLYSTPMYVWPVRGGRIFDTIDTIE